MPNCWAADAPTPENGVLLGTFEVQRSRGRRVFGIEDEKLLDFPPTHGDEPVTLILVRETSQVEGEGPGLVHAFASCPYPESSGPTRKFAIE